ncbi:hypothetical protein PanWU01x14_128800 [Parasponia andersonii]|uniref:Uncharacterized protein n=1 Tax=Parasponia andersonii TaxID=3476 RepID=A0A2P5CRQ2_PARAD|nr:hypothetical protein PanWU01x14_128800 [Parasponia andersonii]
MVTTLGYFSMISMQTIKSPRAAAKWRGVSPLSFFMLSVAGSVMALINCNANFVSPSATAKCSAVSSALVIFAFRALGLFLYVSMTLSQWPFMASSNSLSSSA